MAEPAAVTQRRHRAHKAGNHAYCRPGGRCDQAPAVALPVSVPAAPAPPGAAVLGPAGQALWDDLMAAYQLTPAQRTILRRACHCADRLDRIDQLVAMTAPAHPLGKNSEGRPAGPFRANPAYKQADETERTFDMLIRSLALPTVYEDEGEVRSPAQQAKAHARWAEVYAEREQPRGPLAA